MRNHGERLNIPSRKSRSAKGSRRVVKDRDERRSEILDVAERLFYDRGYERTPISAIIDAIGIAKGTFYHHFRSKQELLDALVERLSARAMQIALPALGDDSLTAVAKFDAIFGGIGSWKLRNKGLFLDMLRALYSEENAAIRRRLQARSLRMFAPVVEKIIAQGVAEGTFTCASPDMTVRFIFGLATDLGELLTGHLLADGPADKAEVRRQIDAYNDGFNRLLGAPEGTVVLYRWSIVEPWFDDEQSA